MSNKKHKQNTIAPTGQMYVGCNHFPVLWLVSIETENVKGEPGETLRWKLCTPPWKASEVQTISTTKWFYTTAVFVIIMTIILQDIIILTIMCVCEIFICCSYDCYFTWCVCDCYSLLTIVLGWTTKYWHNRNFQPIKCLKHGCQKFSCEGLHQNAKSWE